LAIMSCAIAGLHLSPPASVCHSVVPSFSIQTTK
jgi:hypothetical protein